MKIPVSAQGAFISERKPHDAMVAVGKVLKSAKSDILLVDPYMDETALTDFVSQADETVTLRLLADAKDHKPSFKPAVERWNKQHQTAKPIEARLAGSRSLHDRLIVIDRKAAWVLTQSLKDLAVRSPASLVRADGDSAQLKIAAYQSIWDAALPI
jgi:hypothetical protein